MSSHLKFLQLRACLKRHYGLLLLLLFLAVFRSYLATSGHLYWPDEGYYGRVVQFVQYIDKGECIKAVSRFFKTHDRPGYILVYTVPVVIQQIFVAKGIISPDNPHLCDIPSLLNVCITLAVTVIFYVILLKLVKDLWLALWGTAVYSLLCNTNLYIRHLLPYDASLLLFMATLVLILRSGRIGYRTAIACGVLSSLAFVTYPGYYLSVIIIGALILATAKDKAMTMGLFLASAASVVVFWEALARLFGRSYIISLFHFGVQGSFEEGYVFAWRYLTAVEGLIGCALLTLFLIYVAFFLFRARTDSIIQVLFISAVLAYLCFGTLSVVFRRVVFHGRVFHMYIPFLVWGAVLAISRIPKPKLRILICSTVAALSLFSFASWASQYAELWYPRDFAYAFLADIPSRDIYNINEHRKSKGHDPSGCSVITVNLKHLVGIPDKIYPAAVPTDMQLVKSAPHPLNFPAYSFEGCYVSERERLRDSRYKMRIYRRLE